MFAPVTSGVCRRGHPAVQVSVHGGPEPRLVRQHGAHGPERVPGAGGRAAQPRPAPAAHDGRQEPGQGARPRAGRHQPRRHGGPRGGQGAQVRQQQHAEQPQPGAARQRAGQHGARGAAPRPRLHPAHGPGPDHHDRLRPRPGQPGRGQAGGGGAGRGVAAEQQPERVADRTAQTVRGLTKRPASLQEGLDASQGRWVRDQSSQDFKPL